MRLLLASLSSQRPGEFTCLLLEGGLRPKQPLLVPLSLVPMSLPKQLSCMAGHYQPAYIPLNAALKFLAPHCVVQFPVCFSHSRRATSPDLVTGLVLVGPFPAPVLTHTALIRRVYKLRLLGLCQVLNRDRNSSSVNVEYPELTQLRPSVSTWASRLCDLSNF